MRIAIAGGPLTGKTRLSAELAQKYQIADVRHTDSLLGQGYEWSQVSEVVASWFDTPGDWIIEGTRVIHALRKWHQQHPGEPPPFDQFLFLTDLHGTPTAAQHAMAKGFVKIRQEIAGWLETRNTVPVP